TPGASSSAPLPAQPQAAIDPAAKAGMEDEYKNWLEQDVRWIITPDERAAFMKLANDRERDLFVQRFWQRRNPTPTASDNPFKAEHYRRISYANGHFAEGQPGWMTDRGRIYVVYGNPDQVRARYVSTADGGQVWSETWHYQSLPGIGHGLDLTFVNQGGHYKLQSPVPGMAPDDARSAAALTSAPTLLRVAQTREVETGKPLAFEVVSIRENKSGARAGKIEPTGDGWRMVNLPFEALLQLAFVPSPGGSALFPHGNISGMPDWGRDRYDVVAKVSPSSLTDWQNPKTQPAMMRTMVQSMLAERCGLKVHREHRTMDMHALEVGKGGPKLKPADPNAPAHPEAEKIPGMGFAVPEDGGKSLHFYGANMALLISALDKGGTFNVQDRTGLTGTYDFVVHLPEPPARSPGEVDSPPDIQDWAEPIAEQLGLKLVATKGEVETLVVDHIDWPSEN
ncbi:MAG TPA: TIGR03435 family protein, partial [Acidobacteriaceae bacterium]|nr:TIGR03435 family protein [Acidobacteriaceae bacterium]